MDVRRQIKDLKIQIALDRAQALVVALEPFKVRVQSSPATLRVVAAIDAGLRALRHHLASQLNDPDLAILTDDELEARIHFVSQVLPYLHDILGLVQNADVGSVPAELAAPLRREIQRHLPGADLVLVSVSNLNYSIEDIAPYLRDILNHLKSQLPDGFPDRVYRASIPAVEYDQALLHCMLAHEMGHPLYQLKQIGASIPPIRISETFIDELYARARSRHEGGGVQTHQMELPFEETLFRGVVTARITRIILNWLEELAADLFALIAFGPAYLQAFIHFALSFQLLDATSDTHPPARLRLRVLFGLLDRTYERETFSPTTAAFLDTWREAGKRPLTASDVLHEAVLLKLWGESTLQSLQDAVSGALDRDSVYSQDVYKSDVAALVPLINAQIPPAEVGPGVPTLTSIPGILNAGWECFISGLEEFRNGFPDRQGLDSFELHRRFNRFMMKTLELNDIVRSWRAVTS